MRAVGPRAGTDGAHGRPDDDRHPALIALENVGHTYRSAFGRAVRAVDGVSLTIDAGEILGLAGPNGAGKSTLIALLLGYLEPSDGRLRIAGMPPRAFVERHGIAYLSELIAIPPRWGLTEALRRYAILAGVRAHERRARVEAVIELLGLEEHRDKRVRQLSKGTLQRLGLAQALLREERVVILDEPTHGLDPVWTQRFRDLVENFRRPGRVILIASHNLDELQRLADRVAIIDHGRLQRVVEPRGATTATAPYVLTVVGGEAVVPGIFPAAVRRGDGAYELPALDLPTLNAGVAALLRQGVLVTSLRPAHSVLEHWFRQSVEGSE